MPHNSTLLCPKWHSHAMPIKIEPYEMHKNKIVWTKKEKKKKETESSWTHRQKLTIGIIKNFCTREIHGGFHFDTNSRSYKTEMEQFFFRFIFFHCWMRGKKSCVCYETCRDATWHSDAAIIMIKLHDKIKRIKKIEWGMKKSNRTRSQLPEKG